jgi:hypothetical protein
MLFATLPANQRNSVTARDSTGRGDSELGVRARFVEASRPLRQRSSNAETTQTSLKLRSLGRHRRTRGRVADPR